MDYHIQEVSCAEWRSKYKYDWLLNFTKGINWCSIRLIVLYIGDRSREFGFSGFFDTVYDRTVLINPSSICCLIAFCKITCNEEYCAILTLENYIRQFINKDICNYQWLKIPQKCRTWGSRSCRERSFSWESAAIAARVLSDQLNKLINIKRSRVLRKVKNSLPAIAFILNIILK